MILGIALLVANYVYPLAVQPHYEVYRWSAPSKLKEGEQLYVTSDVDSKVIDGIVIRVGDAYYYRIIVNLWNGERLLGEWTKPSGETVIFDIRGFDIRMPSQDVYISFEIRRSVNPEGYGDLVVQTGCQYVALDGTIHYPLTYNGYVIHSVVLNDDDTVSVDVTNKDSVTTLKIYALKATSSDLTYNPEPIIMNEAGRRTVKIPLDTKMGKADYLEIRHTLNPPIIIRNSDWMEVKPVSQQPEIDKEQVYEKLEIQANSQTLSMIPEWLPFVMIGGGLGSVMVSKRLES